MKKKLILLPLSGALLYLFLTSNAAGPGGTSAQERTGASGLAGCGGSSCHGTLSSPGVSLSIQLLSGTTPVTSYSGGGTYTIRLSGINTIASSLPKFGFQVAAVKTSTTTNAGILSAISGTHLVPVSGINLVEHNPLPLPPTTGTGGGGSSYVVNIPWTAPVSGTGSVSLFGAINLVNNNTFADAGDNWKGTSLIISEISSTLGPITGVTNICTGASTVLSNTTPGGIWSSSAPSVATIGSASGIVNGLSFGITTISYNAGSSGIVTTIVTVNPIPNPPSGTLSFCQGSTTILTTPSTGGIWSSGNIAVATVGSSTGIVNGISVGTAAISYSFASGCHSSRQVTVNSCTLHIPRDPSLTTAGLNIYPNPSCGKFCLSVSSTEDKQVHTIVTDIMGKKVMEFVALTNNTYDIQLDAGVYFISAATMREKYTQVVNVK